MLDIVLCFALIPVVVGYAVYTVMKTDNKILRLRVTNRDDIIKMYKDYIDLVHKTRQSIGDNKQ